MEPTTQKNKNFWNVKNLTLIALMTAVICILSPFSIQIVISPVPITLGVFAIYLTLMLLGMKRGTVSCLLYILLGLVGIPVFSGFSGGAGKLLGPTGGYIIGYIFLALIAGFFIDRFFVCDWPNRWYLCLAGMVLGTAICYLFGTVWLAYQMELSFSEALAMGVLPYIPADLIKMVLALLVGIPLRKALIRAHLV